ncbi:hypothetical protein CI610_00529 [invertebrate metagenome]|uniref:Metal-binding protein n=1 Tax=invertebrate metagenome TaxID=1711999 RepID=A0A2H9TB77_9ZZZZ
MPESVHGHNVIAFINSLEKALPHDILLSAIIEHFGESQIFHTCKRQGLSAQELLQHFESKGKLIEDNGMLKLMPCHCHEHHDAQ